MARDALIEEYYPLRAPEGPAASQVLQPRSTWKERVYKLLGCAGSSTPCTTASRVVVPGCALNYLFGICDTWSKHEQHMRFVC